MRAWQYFRGAVAAVVLYDVTCAESLEGARRWLDDLKAELPRSAALALVLAGSKLDLAAERREVSLEAARALAAEAGALHLECSAKDGTNVALVFESIARLIAERGATAGRALHEMPGLTLAVEPVCGRSRGALAGCGCQ